jgi:hypothetical protein
MNCADWEIRVALHAGGDLTGSEAVEVQQHLGECSACQLLWSGIRESLAELQAAHAEAPAQAHFTAVRSRVMGELEHSARPWRRLAWISGVGAAALLLMLLLWPSRVAPEVPRVLASIPPAPEVVKSTPVVHRSVRRVMAHERAREPLTVKLQTTDPNIVIYWIAD